MKSKLPVHAAIGLTSHDNSCAHLTLADGPHTLSELFHAIHLQAGFSSLKLTAQSFGEFVDRPANLIQLDDFFCSESRKAFSRFLRDRGFSERTIVYYKDHIANLRKRAEKLGWTKYGNLPEAWKPVLALASQGECVRVAEYFARLVPSPAGVTEADVAAWERAQVTTRARKYSAAYTMRYKFLKLLRDLGYTEYQHASHTKTDYAASLDELPMQLKIEIEKLRRSYMNIGDADDQEWRDECGYGSASEILEDHTEHMAGRIVGNLRRIYGFVKNIRGQHEGIDSLERLITRPILYSYASWALNSRNVMGSSLSTVVGSIFCSIRRCPGFENVDLSWTSDFMNRIPRSSDGEKDVRRAKKYLAYSALETIPAQIRSERDWEVKRSSQLQSLGKGLGLRMIARLSMEELLMKWLLILLWRNSNIRECRIGGSDPNLFQARIDPFCPNEKPTWVEEEEQRNPNAEFWQFRFSARETKGRRAVRCVLPKELVAPLEQFLDYNRVHLLRGADPGTLFLNLNGKPMSSKQLTSLVSALTLRYCGTTVTPHLFRHSLAFAWLKSYPEDFVTLSKILWHAEPTVTLKLYGARFDESCGVNAMDEWAWERKQLKSCGDDGIA